MAAHKLWRRERVRRQKLLRVVKTKLDQSTHLPVLKLSIKLYCREQKTLEERMKTKEWPKERGGGETLTFFQDQELNSS